MKKKTWEKYMWTAQSKHIEKQYMKITLETCVVTRHRKHTQEKRNGIKHRNTHIGKHIGKTHMKTHKKTT